MSGAVTPSWITQLQPASWRGVPFGVFEDEAPAGRMVAEHEYPFRDVPYIEDMNRAPRRFSLRGFLVGDNCYQQESAMRAAVETAGPGLLVHPVYGSLTVSLAEPMRFAHSVDRGRVVTLDMVFVQGGVPLYPSTIASTQQQTQSAASATSQPMIDDYTNQVLKSAPDDATVTIVNQDGSTTTYGPVYQA